MPALDTCPRNLPGNLGVPKSANQNPSWRALQQVGAEPRERKASWRWARRS
jgi:hypothetical protein